MSYYTALIAAWNGATQLPAGVSGTPLTAQMTTAQKILAVNGWIITGAIPTSFFVTGSQLENCVNYAEFKALTAQQQVNLEALFNSTGQLLGGNANTGLLTDGEFLDYFSHTGPTIAALTALAQGIVTPWYSVSVANGGAGLSGPVSLADTQAAGIS